MYKITSIPALIVLILFWFNAGAQQDSTKATLTLAGIYNSNISYYGQATSEKYPYVLFNATYRLPIGLYFSAGAYKLLNYGSGLSETDLGLGYDYEFDDRFSAGLAFSHSFFPANSPLLQAANANNLNASLNYSWPWFKSVFNADYAFGKEKDMFLSLNHSKDIELGHPFSENNLLSIEPGFEIVAGTTHFYETYIIEKTNRGKGNGKSGSAPGQTKQPGTTTTVQSNKFKMLSYNFKLPLTFSRANYLAEASYQFSILGSGNQVDVAQHQSFFGLSFYYQF